MDGSQKLKMMRQPKEHFFLGGDIVTLKDAVVKPLTREKDEEKT